MQGLLLVITPGDLTEYTPEPEKPSPKQKKNSDNHVSTTTTEKPKQDIDSVEDFSSSQCHTIHFFLTVIPKVKESDTGVQTSNFVMYVPDKEVA